MPVNTHSELNPGAKCVFIFSCPGQQEHMARRPVAGQTGDRLNLLLAYLGLRRSEISITNATTAPLWLSRDGRTEATDREVTDARNLDRLMKEIGSTQYVVACGRKARLALARLGKEMERHTVVLLPHLGNYGLMRVPGHSLDSKIQYLADLVDDGFKQSDFIHFKPRENNARSQREVPPDHAPAEHPLLAHIGVSSQTLLDFFLAYSRLEYSLKHSYQLDEPRAPASDADLTLAYDILKPRWNALLEKLRACDGDMCADPEYLRAKNYLLDQNVMTEFISGRDVLYGEIKSKKLDEYSKLKFTISTIRNNLFHGGKFRPRPGFDMRTEQLLRNVVILIGHWSQHAAIRQAFLAGAA